MGLLKDALVAVILEAIVLGVSTLQTDDVRVVAAVSGLVAVPLLTVVIIRERQRKDEVRPVPPPAPPQDYYAWAEKDRGELVFYLEFPGFNEPVGCSVREPSGREHWATELDISYLTMPGKRDPRGAPQTSARYPSAFHGAPVPTDGRYEVGWYADGGSGRIIEQGCAAWSQGAAWSSEELPYSRGPCSSSPAISSKDHM